MSAANGGEADLAPVIPLFGAQPELQPEHAPERAPLPEREPRPQRERDVPEHDAAEGCRRWCAA